ncbi:MAG: DUF4115 domain-containing protein [Acidobacteria bacterium]|nr:DUF4115 domain-containing protein [Acidobacteriota bacterium]
MPSSVSPIGRRLRQARQDRRLSIEESAWRTRIRPDLLRALEREQFQALEHAGFVRRHLSSYARFLGLDPAEIVEDYARCHEPPDASPIEHLDRRRRQAKRPPRAKWLIAAAASGALLVAASVVGVLGGGERDVSLSALSSAGPRLGPAAASRLAPLRVTVRVLATSATHLSVMVDSRTAFEGDLAEGQGRSFAGRSAIEVVAGNGAAVRLTVNGTSMGAPGKAGSVYRARFGPTDPR